MPDPSTTDDEMLPEYDFIGGVRGKHYKALREGYTVKINQADGTTLIQHFKLEEGTALLDPDVRKYYPGLGGSEHSAALSHPAGSPTT